MKTDFEALKASGEALLETWVKEQKQESLYLEFKRKSEPSKVGMEKADKQNLGRTLSGFSNAQGGLVVWGVNARKGPDGIDCIQDLAPIAQIEKFRVEVEQKLSDYLMPRHELMEVATIKATSSAEAGYLAIWVGESNRRPHRSEAPDDKRYYRRTAFGTHIMEHYEIQDLFQINSVARLEPVIRVGELVDHDDWYSGSYEVWLKNDGPISARESYIIVERDLVTQRSEGTMKGQRVPNKDFKLFQVKPIHPFMECHVFDICFTWKKGTEQYSYRPDNQFWTFENLQPLKLALICGCENSRPQNFNHTISRMDIEQMFDKVRAIGNESARRRDYE